MVNPMSNRRNPSRAVFPTSSSPAPGDVGASSRTSLIKSDSPTQSVGLKGLGCRVYGFNRVWGFRVSGFGVWGLGVGEVGLPQSVGL